MNRQRTFIIYTFACLTLLHTSVLCGAGTWSSFGPEQLVQAGDPLEDISLAGYTVPSCVDWNNDGKNDLIVGAKCAEVNGSGIDEYGKVYVYLNEGTADAPVLGDPFFAQADSNDITCPVTGCMSCFPRVVYWDGDGRKDLLMGQSDGTIKLFLNNNTDAAPSFDGGRPLQVGPAGSKQDIVVFMRATPSVVDWNSDGRKDLISGAYDGKIYLYMNEGTDSEPNFLELTFAQENGSALVVPGLRSSPCVLDVDGDGRKDILTGNTEGQILLYLNVGTDEAPTFSGYTLVESEGAVINLPTANPSDMVRSRPFVCDWTGDGYYDLLIGAGTSRVHLFQGQVFAGDLEPDGDVDLADFTSFALWWLDSECNLTDDCGGADIFGDGAVLLDDLLALVQNWLAGK